MNNRPLALIVEDEQDIVELLVFSLSSEGYAVQTAMNLADAQHLINQELPDVLILDRMLPDGEGVAWLKRLRRHPRTENLPVLLLTARATESDKLEGLNSGSDDYITKPFSPKELIARIKSVLRRAAPQHVADIITFSGCLLNDDTRTLSKDGQSVTVGNSEYQLLKFFLTHPNKTYTRSQLLDLVWGDHVFVEERTVDVHILRLRKILQPFGVEKHLETIRGVGYCWNDGLVAGC